MLFNITHNCRWYKNCNRFLHLKSNINTPYKSIAPIINNLWKTSKFLKIYHIIQKSKIRNKYEETYRTARGNVASIAAQYGIFVTRLIGDNELTEPDYLVPVQVYQYEIRMFYRLKLKLKLGCNPVFPFLLYTSHFFTNITYFFIKYYIIWLLC